MQTYIHTSMFVCVLLGSKLLIILKKNYTQYCLPALGRNKIARTYSSIKKSNYLLCTLSIFFEGTNTRIFLQVLMRRESWCGMLTMIELNKDTHFLLVYIFFSDQPGTHYVTKARPEPKAILNSQPPKCQGQRHELPRPVFRTVFKMLQATIMLEIKHLHCSL